MKKFNFLAAMSVVMVVAVAALIGVAGVNLSKTVKELDVAVTKIQSDTVIARTDPSETRLAQDGTEYVAPLGENTVTEPDASKVLATAVGTQGMIIGVLSVCLVVVISLVVRYWRRAHSQVE